MPLTAIKKMHLGVHGVEASVDTALIANNAIQEAKLAALSVSTRAIAAAAITTAKIDDAAVTTAKVNDGAINNAKIASDADIAWSKMTANAQIRGTLDVDLAAQFDADLTVGANKIVLDADAGNLTVAGASQLDGNLTVGASKVVLNATSGNGTFKGNLEVEGDLLVKGATVTLDAQTVLVEDKLMQLGFIAADGSGNAVAPTGAIGISVFNGKTAGVDNGDQSSLVWETDKWKFAKLAANGTVGDLQNVSMADLVADDIDGTTLDLTTSLTVATDKFTVASSGNTKIGGTLEVDGATNIDANFQVRGASDAVKFSVESATGNLVVKGTSQLDGTTTVGVNKVVLNSDGTVTGGKFISQITGDGVAFTSESFELLASGKLIMSGDVNLYRSAANTLKTDDKLVVGLDLNVMGNSDLDGTLNVDGAVTMMSTANVAGNFSVGSTKFVVTAASGDLNVNSGKLQIAGASGNLTSKGDIVVKDGADATMFSVAAASGNTAIAGDLSVASTKFTVAAASGNVYALGTLEVDGAAQLDSTLDVAGDFKINTNKFVVTAASGNTAIKGDLAIDGDKFVVTALSGNTAIKGDLAVNTNKFTVAADSGNTVVAGTLNAGASTLASLTVSGAAVISGNLTVNGTVTYVNSTDTQIKDRLIYLNLPEGTLANDAPVPSGISGFVINRGKTGSNLNDRAAMVWDEAASRFKLGLTADDAIVSVGDLQVDDLYAAKLHGDGDNITGLTAAKVAITPITNLTGSTVQAGLANLQAQLDSIGSGSLVALQAEVDAIEAAVGLQAAGTLGTPFTGTVHLTAETTVINALKKLDTEVDKAQDDLAAHIALGTDAHDASAISVTASGNLSSTNVQTALGELQGDIDTINAKAWRQAFIYDAVGAETELAKPVGAPNIPAGASTQVFIDGRKVFEGADKQYQVAGDGSKITFAALAANQSVELLYWA